MIVRQIRLTNHEKDRLARLKGRTGIPNWNVLCRWALCLSLSEPSAPHDFEVHADSNVEIPWHVFAGDQAEIYEALIRQRCLNDGFDLSPETLVRCLRLHLFRGIDYLSAPNAIRSCADLLGLVLKEPGEPHEGA